jgi:hypothetical protein
MMQGGGYNFFAGNTTASVLIPASLSTMISQFTDFAWREQMLFRFALPEGVLVSPPHRQCGGAAAATTSSVNELASQASSSGDSSDGASPPSVDYRFPEDFSRPPDRVVIAVYERSFFSDHKLGNVEIGLEHLSDRKSVARVLFVMLYTKYLIDVFGTIIVLVLSVRCTL